MAEEKSNALLQILEEKDKLIVSLKESQTKRDKLNEQQIKILSEDNQAKTEQLKLLDQRIKDLRYDVLKKDAEISIYRITNEKITDRLESLKREIGNYRESINREILQLKASLEKEMREKEALHQIISTDLKSTIVKLESKLREVEEHYVSVIRQIAEKQAMAKKAIRTAMDNLQDASSLLDLGSQEVFRPHKIEEEFGQIVDSAKRNGLEREEEIRKASSGSTVIENIENVNVKLMNTPVIENLFSEISSLQRSAQAELENVAHSAAEGGAGNHAQNTQAKGGSFAGSQVSSAGQVRAQPGSPAVHADSSGGSGGGTGTGGRGAEYRNRTIIDKENFAPFDWQKVLNDLQLKKYGDLIRSCDAAIRSGDYNKAIKLFKTIRDQPGISDTEVTSKMIDEEILYLEKMLKDRYTKKPE
jgi:hypothetical protein